MAGDLAALMDALGHERFAVAGHDTGMWIGYALAADHPGRVARLAVAETPLPGVTPSPPLFANAHLNNALWHFAFNRLAAVNDQLVAGREEIYFGWQFATKAARPLPGHAVRHYIGHPRRQPRSAARQLRDLPRAGCHHRAEPAAHDPAAEMPVLGIGGEHSLGDQVADTMKLAADDVQALVIPGCGHRPPEEAPEETLTALTAFLAPYRDEQPPAHTPAPRRPRPSRARWGKASPEALTSRDPTPARRGGHGNARSCPDQGRAHPTDRHNSAVRRARQCLRKELSCPSRAKCSPPPQY